MSFAEIEIPKSDPFKNCELKREPYADVLTDIITTNPDGFVIAMDNKWGTGKTTFVKMWNQKLQNLKFQTLYFNAWENDFENNPFVAITAELKELIKNENSDKFRKVLKKGSEISKAVIPSLLKTLLKNYTGEDIAEIIRTTADGTLEAFQEDIDTYLERKKDIHTFHKDLESYIEENSDDKPIIFIIDELDRCRPDYAVSLLENIKHLFSVKGIVFVLTIDKEQLGHAICGVYGSENINTEEYLRKFIDIEYSIPQPDLEPFVRYLYNKYDYEKYFSERPNNTEIRYEKESFFMVTQFLFKMLELTLRQQEKIFLHMRIALNSFKKNNYILPEMYVYLSVLKMHNYEVYDSIMNRKYSTVHLLSMNKDFLQSQKIIPSSKRNLAIEIEAKLLVMYNNYLEDDSGMKIEIGENQKAPVRQLPPSQFDNSNNKEVFKSRVELFYKNFDYGRTSLEYLFNKLELVDPLIKEQ